MNKRKTLSIIKTIERHMKEVAKARDNLDESISELNALKEDCDNAYDSLQDARDALSELV